MKIIQLCGKKQSGKTTTANYITGLVLKKYDIIKDFTIGSNGKLYINAQMEQGGKKQSTQGELDMSRRDEDFAEYASHNIWPHVKVYNFADYLKHFLADIFGLDDNKLFGSDDDKNELSPVFWNNMAIPRDISKKDLLVFKERDDRMTYREVMQVFGTDICRYINPRCWGNAGFRKIHREQPDIAIIGDCRFEDEVDLGIQNHSNLILHNNSKSLDNHSSESGLDSVDESLYTYVMPDKQTITMQEKFKHIDMALIECGLSYILE